MGFAHNYCCFAAGQYSDYCGCFLCIIFAWATSPLSACWTNNLRLPLGIPISTKGDIFVAAYQSGQENIQQKALRRGCCRYSIKRHQPVNFLLVDLFHAWGQQFSTVILVAGLDTTRRHQSSDLWWSTSTLLDKVFHGCAAILIYLILFTGDKFGYFLTLLFDFCCWYWNQYILCCSCWLLRSIVGTSSIYWLTFPIGDNCFCWRLLGIYIIDC